MVNTWGKNALCPMRGLEGCSRSPESVFMIARICITSGFTAIGIAGRSKIYEEVFHTGVTERESNMYQFLERSLEMLNKVIREEHGDL